MIKDYANFIDSFENCEIDTSQFGHTDHIGVAYEMLSRYDFLDACVRYSCCIKTIAADAGAAGKFNTTITLAFLSIIAERMELKTYASANEFIRENDDLLSSNPLSKWYSQGRLGSALAREVFLMPDAAA